MTPDQIKLNMPVMTPLGKGVVVEWTVRYSKLYLVKLKTVVDIMDVLLYLSQGQMKLWMMTDGILPQKT